MTTTPTDLDVTVPDLGDFNDLPIIEIHVAVGDTVSIDDPLVTLESDKATMDVPAPAAGIITRIAVTLDDRVTVDSLLLTLDPSPGDAGGPAPDPNNAVTQQESPIRPEPESPATPVLPTTPVNVPPATPARPGIGLPHAGPSARRLARELDIDLDGIAGTGGKGRITTEDLLNRASPPAVGPSTTPAGPTSVVVGAAIPVVPVPDFTQFGPTKTVDLTRIKRISGAHLWRSWINVPHVTHNDDADITELDGYRRDLDTQARPEGYRITLLAFLIKAAVVALRAHPELNSSLTADGQQLTYKSYYHIGVAVDTPNGLLVPVIRDADRKGINELSKELADLSQRAREGRLTPSDMQGGSFTISSLGGIGGTSFTPIVNAPEVAILGVVRSRLAPVWDGSQFLPRLMLPLSLSYDHRVVDGAQAARFTRYLGDLLQDIRRLIL